MRNVYVAGKTDDWQKVRKIQALLIDRGMHITFDWTAIIEEIGPRGGLKGEVADDFRAQCAENDREGVRNADLFVMLCGKGLCGTLIEFGMASILEMPIIVVGEPERDSVFFELPEVERCPSIEDLSDFLEEHFGLVNVNVED